MILTDIPGDLIRLDSGGEGRFVPGEEGVEVIYTAKDRKADFIVYPDKVLVYVKSSLGFPAIYLLPKVSFSGPAHAVLMDLDGTSVKSEAFWVWVIEQTTARLLGDKNFRLEPGDEPHVSGHSVSEHLQYCIRKYCPGKPVEEARKHYFKIVKYEMNEIVEGRGRVDAFVPAAGLREFLTELKKHRVKIGLVTSGLYEKAWPEILSAFRVMDLGDPREFYDAIITAGYALRKGEPGTLGELSPKPHPWLYAETACVGLGIAEGEKHKVIGLEDSSAGVLSLRLAGFQCIGIDGGNIAQSGMESFLYSRCGDLREAIPVILGQQA